MTKRDFQAREYFAERDGVTEPTPVVGSSSGSVTPVSYPKNDEKRVFCDTKNSICTTHDAVPAAKAPNSEASPLRPRAGVTAGKGTGEQPAPPCVETDTSPSGSSGGPINRSAERQSPASDWGGAKPLDDTRPDTKGEATGGRGHFPDSRTENAIDVEELLGELHHIAGIESVEYDIRVTASDAEHAIDLLRAWVNELQLSKAEVDALEYVVVEGRIACHEDYGILRSLLVRLRPEWETKPDKSNDSGSDLAVAADSLSPFAKCETDSPQPVAWAVIGDGYEYVSLTPEMCGAWASENGGRIVPLYRTPQPHATPGDGTRQGGCTQMNDA